MVATTIGSTGLPNQLLRGLEDLSGFDLGDIKVNYSQSLSSKLDDNPFAKFTEIFLAEGQDRHLPHEAWHVTQQAEARTSTSLDVTEDARETTEIAYKVGEKLPYIGTPLKLANFDSVLNSAEALLERVDAAVDKADDALDKVDETYTPILDKIDTASTVFQAAAVVTTGVLTEASLLAAHSVQAAYGDILPDASSGSAKEKALQAFETRYLEAEGPIIAFVDKMEAVFDSVEDAFGAVMTPWQTVVDLFDELGDTLDVFDDLGDALAPFKSALSAVSAPFDAIFNFLENPPSVPIYKPILNPFNDQFPGYWTKISAFPAISRSSIDKVLDFIDKLSGTVLKLLDPVLKPIGDLIDPLLQPVRDLMAPIEKLLAPLAEIPALVDKLLAAIGDMPNPFDAIEELIKDLIDGPVAIPEVLVPELGETISTFFGSDADDSVVGRKKRGDVAAEDEDIEGAVLSGAGGDDKLTGTGKSDLLLGGDDQDVLNGRGGSDVIEGGDGKDVIRGQGGNDSIDGGAGNDKITGNAGDDELSGGAGADTVKGGAGDDRITGGADADLLAGNAGNDVFVFAAGDGVDKVKGFTQGEDQIEIEGVDFEDLTFVLRAKSTIIEYGDLGDQIILKGMTETLTESDFV